jgi:hypothetical protein
MVAILEVIWNRSSVIVGTSMVHGSSRKVGAQLYSALVARIAATDRLIDRVVYRLYGLKDEEIAVVEGNE